jgi:hypothetical protein
LLVLFYLPQLDSGNFTSAVRPALGNRSPFAKAIVPTVPPIITALSTRNSLLVVFCICSSLFSSIRSDVMVTGSKGDILPFAPYPRRERVLYATPLHLLPELLYHLCLLILIEDVVEFLKVIKVFLHDTRHASELVF